jgi:protein arginine N-methyltransferase 1/protein arginine N-methyltransferase 6
VTRHAGHSQRQSSFLSLPLRPGDLITQTAGYQPQLGEQGRALAWAMQRMDGSRSIGELARAVAQDFPTAFVSEQAALQLLRSLARQFG